MEDPLAALRTAEVATLFAVSLGATLSWGALFAPLRTALTPHGILDLQFAWKSRRAAEIVNAWDAGRLLGTAKRSVLLDLLWIAFYACALATLGTLAARAAGASDVFAPATAQTAAAVLTYAALAAAVSDLVENAGLWQLLKGSDAGAWPLLTAAAASVKWLLILTVAATAPVLLACSAVNALLTG